MPAKLHLSPNEHAQSHENVLRPESLTLRELLTGIATISPVSPAEAERKISEIAYNSRNAKHGSAFFAIRGETTNGNLFVFDAAARGVTAIVSEMPRPGNVQ